MKDNQSLLMATEDKNKTPKPAKANNKIDEKLGALWKDKRSYSKRLTYAGAVMLALLYPFLFFGPLETVAFASASLSFQYSDIFWPLLGIMLATWLITSPLVALLRGKVYNLVMTLAFSLALCFYLQGLLLNGSLGTLTGDGVNWPALGEDMLANLLLWLVVFVAVSFVLYLHRRTWRQMVVWASAALVAVQLVPTVAIAAGAYRSGAYADITGYSLTEKGLYDLSEKKNAFVFVLDRLDYDYVQAVLDEDPHFFDSLSGFTQYTNAISSSARTKPALSQILTLGADLAYSVDTKEYFDTIWQKDGTDLLQDLSGAGYRIGLYTSLQNLFSNAQDLQGVANAGNGQGQLLWDQLLPKLYNLSAYRYLPLAMKPFYWAATSTYNEGVHAADDAPVYAMDDMKVLGGFDNAAVTLKDESSFKFIHLMGPHAPYTLNADGTRSQEPTSAVTQTKGCFALLFEVFSQMKALGIYDDATIIITADHGSAVNDTKPLLKATRIGLFYKPAGATGALKLSSDPVSTANVAATLIASAGLDKAAYGLPLEQVTAENTPVRYYYKSISDPGGNNETGVCRYRVVGDAADFANWILEAELPVVGKFY